MSLFLWFLILFWAFVYAIRAWISSSSSSQSLLPISASASTSRNAKLKLKLKLLKDNSSVSPGSGGLVISVQKYFHLEVRSNAFNALHEYFVDFFSSKAGPGPGSLNANANALGGSVLRWFYDVGTILGACGFLLGLGVMLYSSARFFLDFLVISPQQQHQKEAHEQVMMFHAKRNVGLSLDVDEGLGSPGTTGRTGFVVNPIIPGVTVPSSHLPFILLALFVAQCFHEVGHAIAGALEGLTLQAVGASLTIALPSAFVSFAPGMDNLSPVARLRVIASGAWHNLVLWGFIVYLASFTRVASVWTALGWQDVSSRGVVVLEVEDNSPLVHHLRPGDIVTALDDVDLGSNTNTNTTEANAMGKWMRHLLEATPVPVPSEQGWCMDASTFFNQPTSCCDPNASSNLSIDPPISQLTCFARIPNEDERRCIDPVPLLVSSPDQKRCYVASDCNELQDKDTDKDKDRDRIATGRKSRECVRPDGSAELLRIRVIPPIWEGESHGLSTVDVEGDRDGRETRTRTVLWSGPRVEVLEQVKVGTLVPRYRFLPLWLPDVISVFFSYLSTLSLSLYIFNLFALPFLDGSHFISAMLDLLADSRSSVSSLSEGENENGNGNGNGGDGVEDAERDVELGLITGVSNIEREGEGEREAASPSGNHPHPYLLPYTYSDPPRFHVHTSPNRTLSPPRSILLLLHHCRRLLLVSIRSWRRLVRRRRGAIQRVVRNVTIALMCITVVGMVWPV